MNKCEICGNECKGECCSGACRARKSRRAHGDKAHDNDAHGDNKAHADERTVEAIPSTIKDCNGVEHEIDYEGRKADDKLLESWADGEGTEYQRRLGVLSMQYSMMNGYRNKSGNLTSQGRRYQGVA